MLQNLKGIFYQQMSRRLKVLKGEGYQNNNNPEQSGGS